MPAYLSEMWALAAEGELQGVVFWIALYLFVVCGYSCIYQFNARRWPNTKGMLLSASVEKIGATAIRRSDQEYRAKAQYSYQVAGQEYLGNRVSSWLVIASHNAKAILNHQLKGVQPDAAGQVDVFYNPKRPEKSYLIRPNQLGLWITFFVCVGPGVLYYYKYYL